MYIDLNPAIDRVQEVEKMFTAAEKLIMSSTKTAADIATEDFGMTGDQLAELGALVSVHQQMNEMVLSSDTNLFTTMLLPSALMSEMYRAYCDKYEVSTELFPKQFVLAMMILAVSPVEREVDLGLTAKEETANIQFTAAGEKKQSDALPTP